MLIHQIHMAVPNKCERIMNELKVAVVGIGNIGSAHAACIANGQIKGMTLNAVCDIDLHKLNSFTERYPDVVGYDNYQKLIASHIVDVVVVSVPHPLHAEIAIAALKNGLHVMLEKPADISVTRVKELNQVAQDSGKKFSIMFNQRTNSLFRRAREIVHSGELGEMRRTSWVITNWYRTQAYYDSGKWRATWLGEGGGVLLNQAPHQLDLWQWICGMPDSIVAYCDIAKYHDIEVEDNVTIFSKYKNGATGTFITSTGEYPGTNRLEIVGDLGKIILENGVLKWWKLNESAREVCRNSKIEHAHIDYEYIEIIEESSDFAHAKILQNFANSIINGETLIAPGEDGILELTISNAAYLSSWLEHKEIHLPFDSRQFDELLKERMKHSKLKETDTSTTTESEYKSRWQVNW